MVKAFQVGKRYRSKGNAAYTYVIINVMENGDAFASGHYIGGNEGAFSHHQVLAADNLHRMEIVPPKPRTGKGYRWLHKQEPTRTALMHIPAAASCDWWESFPIEWTEVLNDKDISG